MKRENSALAGLCSANIHGLAAAASLSPGSQRVTCFGVERTEGWRSPFQRSAPLQVIPLSHQCEARFLSTVMVDIKAIHPDTWLLLSYNRGSDAGFIY